MSAPISPRAFDIRDTPWGRADRVTMHAPGIHFVSTPSHGGFHLDEEHNAKVPEAWRKLSWNGRGVGGWYEEDCDWAMVALTFPDLFDAGDLVNAVRTFDNFTRPKLLKAGVHVGQILPDCAAAV